MKKISLALMAAVSLLGTFSNNARADLFPAFNPATSIAATTAQVNSLLQLVGVTWAHRAYQPATPLGMLVGLDIGVETTGLSIPADISTALGTFTGSTPPSFLLLPKLNIHKGLPLGIDLGFSFATFAASGQTVTSIGGDINWAFISGAALPSIAVRGGFSSNNFWFMQTTTWTLDALISKNLVFIDPYVGGGARFWNGTVSVPVGALPANISASGSGVVPHIFGGLALKMGFFHMTGEADYSTTGLLVYGGKVSFGF